MPEKVVPGPVQDNACIREAVCIHTKKIFDSCRDKDCIEDLRFYPTQNSQSAIERAISIKPGTAELLYVYIDVEPVGFNRGFYTVDVRYFYRVTADAFVGAARPVEICGLCVFDKRVILFGSEGNAKIFSSEACFGSLDEQNMRKSNLPTAVVEAVDPIVLSMKLCHPGPVLHHPPGAGDSAPHAGLRLLHAGEGVRLRLLRRGGPLRDLPPRQVPRGRVFPAQQPLPRRRRPGPAPRVLLRASALSYQGNGCGSFSRARGKLRGAFGRPSLFGEMR